MAFLGPKSVVSYSCTCGQLKPISRLYFCRHCFELRCGFCVSHEIDARYCTTCVESMHVTEAWMKGNCCSNCLLCPICQSNLSTRITQQQKPKPKADDAASDGKQEAPTKVYYLLCLFCHWTTRDIGMPDALKASGWTELENPNATRISDLTEYYKAVAVQDRTVRDKKSHGARRGYTHISGMSAALARQKAGLTGNIGMPFRSPESFHDSNRPLQVTRAEPSAAVDDLPDDIYSKPPLLTSLTTMKQRLNIPEMEPTDLSKVCFIRKPLAVKRSLRCRVCEHNVSKPEYAPSSIKFKIQLSAYHLIPEVRIKTVEPLRSGETSDLLIVITNPTQHPTTVQLLPFDHDEPPRALTAAQSDLKSPPCLVPSQPLEVKLVATVELPRIDIPIHGRDDAAEFDEPGESPNFNDDTKIIVWRKANKVVIKMKVKPESNLEIGTEVTIGYTMRHIYTNTVIQQEKKELQQIPHAFKMVLDLGKVVGSK